jgi:hypothetical protein
MVGLACGLADGFFPSQVGLQLQTRWLSKPHPESVVRYISDFEQSLLPNFSHIALASVNVFFLLQRGTLLKPITVSLQHRTAALPLSGVHCSGFLFNRPLSPGQPAIVK